MKISNSVLHRFISALFVLAISGCASLQAPNQEHTSTVLSKDGSEIVYGVKGQGKTTLVFVHCWTCNHRFWKSQIDYFAKSHKVVWLDLAGHGQSGSARVDYTMEAFGEDVAAVVNAVGTKKVILVGHSMGGPVVVEAAKKLDQKVVAIVGVDTFYTPFQYPESESEIDVFVKPIRDDFVGASQQMVQSMFTPKVDPELKASIVKQFTGTNPEMGISAMYELFRWHAQDAPSSLEYFSDKLSNINAAPSGNETPLHKSVLLIPNVGHFVPQVKPDEFNAVLNSIISEHQ
ncbi:MAG: alpha/beta hydrolase [Gammaproteobacteria bacterium]|nr:alpha/beta hydrolase [Gammaproteobacteria bacterium]